MSYRRDLFAYNLFITIFSYLNLYDFAVDFPYFRQPNIIGEFSLNGKLVKIKYANFLNDKLFLILYEMFYILAVQEVWVHFM